MSRKRFVLLLLALLTTVSAACALAEEPRVIHTEPALPPVTLELEELWRAGGEGADDLMFGLPVEARGDHLLVAGSRSVPQEKILERIHFLAAVDQEGKETVRYLEQRSEIQRPHSVVHENDFLPAFPLAATLGPDGRVYSPRDREKYEVVAFRPDGEIDYVIERPAYRPWKRNKLDRQRVEALFHAWAGANPETWPEFDLKKTERAITSLQVDGRNRLWVQHARSNRDLPDGRLLLIKGYVVARLACLGSGMATLGEDDTEVIEIICYRLPDFG